MPGSGLCGRRRGDFREFFGWNFGLAVGGFGGLAIATIIVAVMYLGICYSIAEMSPAQL